MSLKDACSLIELSVGMPSAQGTHNPCLKLGPFVLAEHVLSAATGSLCTAFHQCPFPIFLFFCNAQCLRRNEFDLFLGKPTAAGP